MDSKEHHFQAHSAPLMAILQNILMSRMAQPKVYLFHHSVFSSGQPNALGNSEEQNAGRDHPLLSIQIRYQLHIEVYSVKLFIAELFQNDFYPWDWPLRVCR